uniref:Uncharacterized protein n=2 Tax=Oryza TaxID=4527 RepID=A0A0D3GE61_9ORYZ
MVLGTSRGGFDLTRIVDAIERHGFNQVYDVGADDIMRAVEVTQEAITVWHVEAESAANGVGLIKLMGWSASHIALHTMLISRRLLPHPGGGLNKLP